MWRALLRRLPVPSKKAVETTLPIYSGRARCCCKADSSLRAILTRLEDSSCFVDHDVDGRAPCRDARDSTGRLLASNGLLRLAPPLAAGAAGAVWGAWPSGRLAVWGAGGCDAAVNVVASSENLSEKLETHQQRQQPMLTWATARVPCGAPIRRR
jgi:hypothetical protein